MDLGYHQRLWMLTAHPYGLKLHEDPPAWLVEECQTLGVVEPASDGIWKLTPAGHHELKQLLN